MTNQQRFTERLQVLKVSEKSLVEKPFAASASDYHQAMNSVAAELKKRKLDGLISLFVFGSKIRKPGVSDLDTGVVLTPEATPDTLLEIEKLVLSPEYRDYFFHRPGLVVNSQLATQIGHLMPIFGEPHIIFGESLPQLQMNESEAWFLRLIAVMNYIALTGVTEPVELWSGPTVSVRLALAKFASLRHIRNVFKQFHLSFPVVGDELLSKTEDMTQEWITQNIDPEDSTYIRNSLLDGTHLWFLALSDAIRELAKNAGQFFDNSHGKLSRPGQLSESRPFSTEWDADTAFDIAIASLRAGLNPIVLTPPELAANLIFYRQNCGPTLGAHCYGRLFFPEIIQPTTPGLEQILRKQLFVFGQQIDFLNQRHMPYGVFHPYGTYFSAAAPPNPWVLHASNQTTNQNRLKNRVLRWFN